MPDPKMPRTLEEVVAMLPEIQKLVRTLVNVTMDAPLPLNVKLDALRQVGIVVHDRLCPGCNEGAPPGATKH